MLLTKIIATLGPASSKPEMISELIVKGVRVFRLNFSHGTFEQYDEWINRIRAVCDDLGISVAILGDLAGPKIRIGRVIDEGVELKKGAEVEFHTESIITQPPDSPQHPVVLSSTYPQFIPEVNPGDRILLDDGNIRLSCESNEQKRIVCRVINGGVITSYKGVNLPDTELSLPALTEKDLKCVEYAVARNLDFLALSFVRQGKDVKQLKDEMIRLGVQPGNTFPFQREELKYSAIEVESEHIMPIISKIEKPQAVNNLIDILEESDAVMIARGDLGVEMDLAQVAVLQKRIIRLCREYSLPCIVATQMLQSMMDSPTPTRAEVSDVANAIFDGADAVMLSGETAIGRFPIQAVTMMNRIAENTNEYIKSLPIPRLVTAKTKEIHQRSAAIANSVRRIVKDIDVKYIIVWAKLGGAAIYLSQQKLPCPILFFSSSKTILRRTGLLYGLTPLYLEQPKSLGEFIKTVDSLLIENRWARQKDAVVFVLAEPMTHIGITNEIIIHYIGESVE